MGEEINYYGRSYEIPKIKRETEIPVSKRDRNKKLHIDFNKNLEQILDSAKISSRKVNKEHFQNWLNINNIKIDSELFIPLYMLNNSFDNYHGYYPNSIIRYKLYKEKTPKLSEIIFNKLANSSEASALAQIYMQDIDIESTYFSGDVTLNKKAISSEEHTFNYIKYKEKEYIYDIINPVIKYDNISQNTIILPRIQEVRNFKEKVNRSEKYLVKTKGITDRKEIFYGVDK